MAKHYNTHVKSRYFNVGDLVLKKVTITTKDPTQGKLSPNWEGPYKVVNCFIRETYHLETLNGRKPHHPWNAEHLKKYY